MILLEQLYRLLRADEQVRLLDPYFETVSSVGTIIGLNATLTVPERKALLLNHAYARILPGTGQNITANTQLLMRNPGATRVVLLDEVPNALAINVAARLMWQGEAVLMPGCTLRLDALFNSGIASNSITLYAHGMLIPLGNIERIA